MRIRVEGNRQNDHGTDREYDVEEDTDVEEIPVDELLKEEEVVHKMKYIVAADTVTHMDIVHKIVVNVKHQDPIMTMRQHLPI